jgi:SAM-dependent methyltransferase
MVQNIYDDPEFFARYGQLRRSIEGLAGAGEWETVRALLPPLKGARVLDIGCGFGAFCRYAGEQGAANVLGIDPSEKMLARAANETAFAGVRFLRASLEEAELPARAFDLVYSALALHYVADLKAGFAKIAAATAPGGRFVFTMEHPLTTARAEQDWFVQDGKRLFWPVDHYLDEGPRRTAWLKDGVIKYHRTLETIVNGLIEAGFTLRTLIEFKPSPEQIEAHPDWADDARRPAFLIVSAQR